MTLDKKPVLHIVDEATRYQAPRRFPSVSTAELQNSFCLAWIDCYLGPPDANTTDASNALTSNTFRNNTGLLQTQTKAVLEEASNTMSIFKKYHESVRRAYRIIRSEAPYMSLESALQATAESGNDSVGSSGLVTTLLIYGAIPRLVLSLDPPAASTNEKARAAAKVTKSVTHYFIQL